MRTTTLKIVQLEADAESGYVTTVHWRLYVQEKDAQAETYGSVSYAPSEEPYVPYAELTEEAVIRWVTAYLGEAVIQAMLSDLDKQLNELSKPSQTTKLPWQN